MKMSKGEFSKRMRKIAKDPDTEAAHAEADKLLCEMLKQLGYGAGVKVFEDMDRWYG